MRKTRWLVLLYKDIEQSDLLKYMEFNTIKEVGYILGEKTQDISNYFHGLIKARGNLRYCVIYQISRSK